MAANRVPTQFATLGLMETSIWPFFLLKNEKD
jgi:hypothetical protein